MDIKFLTRDQAAERYSVGLRTLDRWLRDGRVPYLRFGRRCIRIEQDAADRALVKWGREAANERNN